MNISQCRSRGRQALGQAAYSMKKLIGIHTAAMLALALVLSLLDYFLAQGVGSTGGLSGLGDRAILETLRSMLLYGNALLLPFWQIGLTAAAIRLVRGQDFGPKTLLEGFRHFGPVLRMNLLLWGIYLLVMMVASQLASMVFMFTPLSGELYALAEQMVAAGTTDVSALLTPEVLQSLMMKMLPFLAGAIVLFLVPVAYRLRMMEYVLMDVPSRGAFFALRMSLAMTKKKCWKLFKLDLSFWWFYVLELLALAVCYGDVLLSGVGVQLPVDAQLGSLLFYLLGRACQLGLYVWKKDDLVAAYACAYVELLPKPVEE